MISNHTCFTNSRTLQKAEAHAAESVDSVAETPRGDMDDVESGPVEAAKRIDKRFSQQLHGSKFLLIIGGERCHG